MKKLDKLVIRAFIGPFIVTTSVVLFIFLMRFILTYFDEFVGKDLGLWVFIKLFTYFTIIAVPVALPLAVLLASLMTYGNLGEYSELTALKSAGISIDRTLLPTGILTFLISLFSFWFNNEIMPWANLKGWSLMYDVKTTKATLNIKEGVFYYDLPGYAIKVSKKFRDNKTLKGLIIYNHSEQDGNKRITLADSGQMYTILNNRYLVFELFNGSDYADQRDRTDPTYQQTKYVRTNFKHNKLVMSLASFDMSKTAEDLFKGHAIMRNVVELDEAVDSVRYEAQKLINQTSSSAGTYYSYHLKRATFTLLSDTDKSNIRSSKWIDSLMNHDFTKDAEYIRKTIVTNSLSQARNALAYSESNAVIIKAKIEETWKLDLEWHHKFTQAIACLVMFLIGAPLGAIIKKGGFGVPVLIAVAFFILSYVLTMNGDKWVKEGLIDVRIGSWLPNLIMFLIGLYFLNRARNDSRLFDTDAYRVYWTKSIAYLQKYKRS
jgi:lipopolysaccharide export system permease protein